MFENPFSVFYKQSDPFLNNSPCTNNVLEPLHHLTIFRSRHFFQSLSAGVCLRTSSGHSNLLLRRSRSHLLTSVSQLREFNTRRLKTKIWKPKTPQDTPQRHPVPVDNTNYPQINVNAATGERKHKILHPTVKT